MNQITKIVVDNGKVKVYHSNEIIDKRNYYHIKFDSYYKGYTDYYVPKKVVSNNTVMNGQLSVTLYVPSLKYLQDEGIWKDKLIEEYGNKYSKYEWYKDPVI